MWQSLVKKFGNRKDFNLRRPVYKTGALKAELLIHHHKKSLFSIQLAAGIRIRNSEK